MVPEGRNVGLVHGRVVVHVGEEDRGLGHVLQTCAVIGQQSAHVLERLPELGLHTAVDDLAVLHADLARHDEPIPGLDDRGVRTNGLAWAHRAAAPLVSLWSGQSCGYPACRHAAAATAAKTASDPLTGSIPPLVSISTCTGGISLARRMPNDRI